MNKLFDNATLAADMFDYIIIGSGSAGSIVASRLADDPNNSVLLIEAGGDAQQVADIWNPNKINCLYNDASIHWGYKTTPQRYMNNRVLDYYRAKITGGCTSHNDMVYTRGAPADFDQWESVYGCSSWNYDSIKQNFARVEAAMQFNVTVKNDFASSYINACSELKIPYNPDYNSGADMFGVSPMWSSIDTNNIRETTYKTYISNGSSRDNLTVGYRCDVANIIFDANTAIGVNFVFNNQNYRVSVNKEIIVSAGAINTPAILMRSGIGDETELKKLGATTIVSNLPGVGKNLQDAIIFSGT